MVEPKRSSRDKLSDEYRDSRVEEGIELGALRRAKRVRCPQSLVVICQTCRRPLSNVLKVPPHRCKSALVHRNHRLLGTDLECQDFIFDEHVLETCAS